MTTLLKTLAAPLLWFAFAISAALAEPVEPNFDWAMVMSVGPGHQADKMLKANGRCSVRLTA